MPAPKRRSLTGVALPRVRLALTVLAALAGCDGLLDVDGSDAFDVSSAKLDTPTGPVHGTLLVPTGAGPHPVALIIPGSGATDRDGNSVVLFPGRNNSLRQLATGLAERGVASLRYDKRGVSASALTGGHESELRFDTYAEDAAGWVRQLKADRRFSTVTIIGHSEGSLVGMIAARQEQVDAFVSIAGTARRASDGLRDQLRSNLPETLWEESERILLELEAGRTIANVSPDLRPLFRTSVQPFLISLVRYLPTEEIARLTVPVLIVQGTTDLQVRVEDAHALHAARPDAELLVVEGMNHILKLAPLDATTQQITYVDPSHPVAPTLLQRIAEAVEDLPTSR